MDSKSSSDTKPETKPASESDTTTISLEERKLALDLMIAERERRGGYNVDAPDILLLAKILRASL